MGVSGGRKKSRSDDFSATVHHVVAHPLFDIIVFIWKCNSTEKCTEHVSPLLLVAFVDMQTIK